jgi:transposase
VAGPVRRSPSRKTPTLLAAKLTPTPWTLPAIYHEIQQRLAHRDTLVDVRQQVRNQLHSLLQLPIASASVKAQLDALDATVSAQIDAIEDVLVQVLKSETDWLTTATHLRSISVMSLLTARWLLVTTLNGTDCASATAASASAGLAPSS